MAAAIYSIVLVYKFYINITKRVLLKRSLLYAIRNDDVQTLKKSVLDAIRDDDVLTLKFLLSTNPEILDLAAKNWPENPIIVACKLRNFHVVEEIRIHKPEFAHLKDDKDGSALLHLACIKGDVEVVRVLVGLDSQLCFVQDMLSMIPLHTAVIHGLLDVIRELLFARPDSLVALTSLDETVFHLAAKNHQSKAFALLLEQAKPNQIYLLDQEDCLGNTARKIAVWNKLLPVDCDSADVTLNTCILHEGVGCEELHSESEDNDENIIMTDILESRTDFHSEGDGRKEDYLNSLHDLEVRENITLPAVQRSWNRRRCYNHSRWPWLLEKKELIKMILPTILIFLGFMAIIVLLHFFPREKSGPNQVVFRFRDVVSGQLPPIFYIMTFITAVFTISVINLSLLFWSLPCGSLLFLCGIYTFVLYALLEYSIMPKFFVRIGSNDVSSYQIMWTLALGLIFFGTIIILLVKNFYYLSSGFCLLMFKLVKAFCISSCR